MTQAEKFAGLARLLEQHGPRELICSVGCDVSDDSIERFVSALRELGFSVTVMRDSHRILSPDQVVVVRDQKWPTNRWGVVQ